MATCSSVLAWRIPGTGEPDELPLWGRTESATTEATQQQQQQQQQPYCFPQWLHQKAHLHVGKVFISSSLMKDILTRQRILVEQSFSFNFFLELLNPYYLACKVSDSKVITILILVPLYILCFPSLVAFMISLFLFSYYFSQLLCLVLGFFFKVLFDIFGPS